MKQISPLLPAALLSLALIACQQADPNNISIDETNNVSEPSDAEALPPSGNADALPPSGNADVADSNIVNGIDESEDDSENSPPTIAIPAQYRGRWGMNVNDCDPKRSDNKGLMTVGGNSIKFYESVAALQEQRPAIATSFSGVFSFTGEGQTWERVITLTRTGDTLKRAQADGNFTYTRCK